MLREWLLSLSTLCNGRDRELGVPAPGAALAWARGTTDRKNWSAHVICTCEVLNFCLLETSSSPNQTNGYVEHFLTFVAILRRQNRSSHLSFILWNISQQRERAKFLRTPQSSSVANMFTPLLQSPPIYLHHRYFLYREGRCIRSDVIPRFPQI